MSLLRSGGRLEGGGGDVRVFCEGVGDYGDGVPALALDIFQCLVRGFGLEELEDLVVEFLA